MTTITTSSHRTPARDDVAADSLTPAPGSEPTRSESRLWAVSGVAAAVTGIGAIIATMGMNAVYDPKISGNADKILDDMLTSKGSSTVFHVLAAASAMLLVPFAAGLHRRLSRTAPADSLLATVAALGVAMTSFVLVMGSGLDTEFGFGLPPRGYVVPESAAFYGHWVGTIPYLWTGVGLAGLALFGAALRHRAVPRWIGLVGLLLGGLTVVAGVSPLEYMAGLVGPVWLLVTAVGFLVGDRAARR
jgi:hypothetical protein